MFYHKSFPRFRQKPCENRIFLLARHFVLLCLSRQRDIVRFSYELAHKGRSTTRKTSEVSYDFRVLLVHPNIRIGKRVFRENDENPPSYLIVTKRPYTNVISENHVESVRRKSAF